MEVKFFSVIDQLQTQHYINPHHIIRISQGAGYCEIILVNGKEITVPGSATEVLKSIFLQSDVRF